jgi:cell division protein FtsA
MSKSKIIAAIDIGSSKITTLLAQANVQDLTLETTINVMGVSSSESKGIKKGQIVDIEEAVEATILSVEGAERMAGYNIDKAFVSVGGGHIQSQNSKGVVAVSDPGGEVSGDDVVRVIESARAISLPASREIIHVIPREYIVDGEAGVRDPVGMTGVRLEVETHIVTASSPALKNLTKTIKEVGIDIEENVFSALASGYSTLTPTEKELGCVLVDIGAGTTSIAAHIDNALAYSGSLPVGARNVTNDLAIGLRVTLDTAEKIKIVLNKPIKKSREEDKHLDLSDFGSKEHKTVAKRTLTEGIIRPRLNEIFSMVKLDLEKLGILNKVPSGAIIVGGGALTAGIEDAARRTLGLPVRVAKPSGVGGLIDDLGTPEFAAAVGLILYGSQSGGKFIDNKPSLTGKIKFPSGNAFGNAVQMIKDLLP